MRQSIGVAVTGLRCEYLVNPLGIDVTNPRLSWMLESAERCTTQTAFRVLVSSSEDALACDQGDLWDSGRMESDQSIHIAYAGAPLKSRSKCFWKVRVWDNHGNRSEWSAPASWTMGLLEASDWTAEWIGLDSGDNPDCLAHAQWIWSPGESADTDGKTRCFRRVVEIADASQISGARLTIGAQDRFTVSVNGERVAEWGRTIFAPVSEFDIEQLLKSGANTIAIAASVSGESERPFGLICALTAEFESGKRLMITSDASWMVSASEADGWDSPGFDDSHWLSAEELGENGASSFPMVPGDDFRRLPARMLRREFEVTKPVSRATAYMCGLGLSELYVNGEKISDNVLSPGLTDYAKRALYVTHDITPNLHTGANAIGAILGNGRYFAPRRSAPTNTVSYGYPKLLLQLEIEYEDGSADTVVSDGQWKITDAGPIRANSEYDGEIYDARKEEDGWSEPGFDDSDWRAVEMVEGPAGALSCEMSEPIRAMDRLCPIAITNPRPGCYVFDMGQNMVGWCRLRVQGSRGTRVCMKHAETLKTDGTLYLDNIRSAKVTDVYVLKGDGVEVYEPRFTYHGFRYVEVTGFPGTPDLSSLEGVVIHDAVERTGEFSCSSALLNQVYRNICWGVRGNYRSIPTDCPQRDERQGWFGDRAQESKGEMYIFGAAALYTKWIRDMRDSQLPDGSLPDLAPAFWPFYTGSVTFPTAALVIPGHLHRQYGDMRILETHYACMRGWVEKMIPSLTDFTMPKDTYGDWCVPPESLEMIWSADPERVTNPELVSTAYFYHDLRLIARYALLLGKAGDASRYDDLADRVRDAFDAKFLNPLVGVYDNGTQTSSILPLAYGLVPDEHRQRVFANLVENIVVKSDCHIGTGMIGCQWLMRVLSDNGRPDVAYRLATQTSYPSWGYMVKQGATTIWELWNGDHGDPLMNSGNHVMQIGDLCTWLHEYVAGISPDDDRPGFKHTIMRPCVVGDLKFASAHHRSMYGRIVSDWGIEGDVFEWRLEVPANTTATVHVPADSPESVLESGKPVRDAVGVELLKMEAGRAVFAIGSGIYSFASRVASIRDGDEACVVCQ